ncbi:MAG: hypothetical protein ACXW3O_03105 [Brevundimonas sp.]
MSQIKQAKAPYSAPKLTAHGTIRNMTHTNTVNGPNDANGPGSYTS